ncbi:MAG: hypothetical protein ABSD74_11310 [Rhizomicrobium sp.]
MGCCKDNTAGATAFVPYQGCYLCRIWKILTQEKRPGGDPCVVLPARIVRKPDPCIYDQFLLMQLGKPVTWDNPDVHIFLGGVEQYTYDLTVSTEYDVEITVHNSSRDVPATGTTVDIHWIEFGAGGTQIWHPITVTTTDVPVWPGVSVVKIKWTTPATPGHYCIEIQLSNPNDSDPSNNRGQNNTQVYAAHSPVNQSIRVFNLYPDGCPQAPKPRGPTFRLSWALLGWGPFGAVTALFFEPLAAHMWLAATPFALRLAELAAAGYAAAAVVGLIASILFVAYRAVLYRNAQSAADGDTTRNDRNDCLDVRIDVDSYVFADNVGKSFDPAVAFQPAPAIWGATVVPSSFRFQPGEIYRDVELRANAPDGPGPSGQFNVNVWQGGVPSGGVTVTVTRGGV